MKVSFKVASILIIFSLLLAGWGAPGRAIAGEGTQPEPQSEVLEEQGLYFSRSRVTLADGSEFEEIVINGPPAPPGDSTQQAPRISPEQAQALGDTLLNVPVYTWVFGCSAVSAAMIAGYYDNRGYPNLYYGLTNGGAAPANDSLWPRWLDGEGENYPNNPLIASHLGLEGRTARGSIDDYWVGYSSYHPDPYITGGWTPHVSEGAVGDFMKTSQSALGNIDGATGFFHRTDSGAPLLCRDMPDYVRAEDGTYGRKLFYESRGYPVTDCYNQKTDNAAAGGFSFAQYRAEINAGHPVMLNLDGHTVVGVGYSDTGNTVYLYDTWNYKLQSMTWGSSYGGMNLFSVSIVHLMQPPGAFGKAGPANKATRVLVRAPISWTASKDATSYEYCYDSSNENACSNWIHAGSRTSIRPSGLKTNTTYYWQVRAVNMLGQRYANDSATAFWSFTTAERDERLFLPLITRKTTAK